MERWLWMILMSFLYKGSCEELISPLSDSVPASEGLNVTLSCKYKDKATRLYWYQKQPRSSPKLLMTDYSTNTSSLGVNHVKELNLFHLTMFSAKLTDSALYYCALQPTVVCEEDPPLQKPTVETQEVEQRESFNSSSHPTCFHSI